MAEVLLFHHVQGRTPGVVAFADRLRAAGHVVHAPDVFDGRTFDTLEEGMAFARQTGFGTLIERAVHEADGLPPELVYIGISFGVMPTQQLAQTRPGARGAVLIDSCVPPSEFGTAWPEGVAAQIHGMDADPIFAGEGDLEAARALADSVESIELFVYPGDQHLFLDPSLPSYRADAAEQVTERVLAFLAER